MKDYLIDKLAKEIASNILKEIKSLNESLSEDQKKRLQIQLKEYINELIRKEVGFKIPSSAFKISRINVSENNEYDFYIDTEIKLKNLGFEFNLVNWFQDIYIDKDIFDLGSATQALLHSKSFKDYISTLVFSLKVYKYLFIQFQVVDNVLDQFRDSCLNSIPKMLRLKKVNQIFNLIEVFIANEKNISFILKDKSSNEKIFSKVYLNWQWEEKSYKQVASELVLGALERKLCKEKVSEFYYLVFKEN